MDNIITKSIDTSNYNKPINTKNKNVENVEASKTQDTKQVLGTDTFVKSTEDDTLNSTYRPTKKKLSTEEVNSIKEDQENSKIELIRKFISDTIKNQSKLLGKSTDNEPNDELTKSTDFLTKIFGSIENAYPPLATTPEGAAAAIAEGGAYSVNAVADRIMTMAKAIAGDDPVKLQQMREAVEEGFSQAGLEFNKATKGDLPQICKDTCAEVLKRFDELQNKTVVTT